MTKNARPTLDILQFPPDTKIINSSL